MELQIHQQRPRELTWFHAGSMLFGDWGTSRLYVLGLAFFYSGFAAPFHILAMCILLLIVGWAYSVVCRCFQDGGGVYSSAKATHQQVALLGAYLMFADYVVTGALSAVEAFRYFGASAQSAPFWAVGSIFVIAGVNFVGPRKAGKLAGFIAAAMIAVMIVTALFCIPKMSLANISMDVRPWNLRWQSFVHIILALSGVEAVANMTGIMVQPVARTSRKAIFFVLAEVVLLNLFFAVAMTSVQSLPGEILADKATSALTDHDFELRDTMMRQIATNAVGPQFGVFASVIFGLLLLSAVNTAMGAMISVQYAMARDNEMPSGFMKLNVFGVPWLGLVTATVICVGVILFEGDVEKLAHLYAIGVVGAITLNLGSTCINRKVSLRGWERLALGIIAFFLFCVEITIAVQKHDATIFAGLVIAGGYIMRVLVKKGAAVKPYIPKVAETVGAWFEAPPLPEGTSALSMEGIKPFDPALPKILVSTRGNPELLKFAAEEAEARGANLLVLFVRDLRLAYGPPTIGEIRMEDDADAVPIFAHANELARDFKIPLMPIYCVARSPAEMILDFAGTYAVDYVIMGVTRRGTVFRALRGDVIAEVAANLPHETKLLIHA